MKHVLMSALLLLGASSCMPEADPVDSTQAAKKPAPPDLSTAPPPDLTQPVNCPTTIDCQSTNPGPGWWVGNNYYSNGVLTCHWANFSPPYATMTFVYAPTGCQDCVWNGVVGRYDCTAN